MISSVTNFTIQREKEEEKQKEKAKSRQTLLQGDKSSKSKTNAASILGRSKLKDTHELLKESHGDPHTWDMTVITIYVCL